MLPQPLMPTKGCKVERRDAMTRIGSDGAFDLAENVSSLPDRTLPRSTMLKLLAAHSTQAIGPRARVRRGRHSTEFIGKPRS